MYRVSQIKARCLMERSMKIRSLISKIGVVVNLEVANLDFHL